MESVHGLPAGDGDAVDAVPPLPSTPLRGWATTLARNFLADVGERASAFRYLIRDRDSIFTDAFDAVFAFASIEIKKSAPLCPKMNAFAERWVTTVRAECADRMLIASDRHLRVVLEQYAEHNNSGRTHQGHGLNLRAPHWWTSWSVPPLRIRRPSGLNRTTVTEPSCR